jgi:hypothetical protein|tara:strand:- start:7150 stop:7761 length:612 start_codon:yes stop_codon:yes gene_type:complete
MENVNFVNMHRYQDIERILYRAVKDGEPKVVIELGHGSGALTSAIGLALRDVDKNGKLYSYDINGNSNYPLGGNTVSALQNVQERNLTDIVTFISGDVFNTWVRDPHPFDLLLIDIDNTWDTIYNIIIANSFINTQVLNGAKVLIEGGDPGHPRINHNTLNTFNNTSFLENKIYINSTGEAVFNITHLGGSGRTSISALELVD